MTPNDRIEQEEHSSSGETTEPAPGCGVARARRIHVFVALLALTVAGGVAARMAGGVPSAGAATAGGTLTAASVAAPDGAVRIGARLDRSRVMDGGDGLVRVELSIAGTDDASAQEPGATPTDLVVVLDRSGSMQGEPIARALAAVRRLVESLGPDDRFGLVTYASSAHLSVPLAPATEAARSDWLRTLSAIGVGGGTHMASGLDAADAALRAARAAERAARVVLISDGHANEGDHSREGLVARSARAVPGEYVLSAVGVGEGFDESLMTALADAGTGNFYYVRHAGDLGDVFAGEFASARAQLASRLAVEIRPAPGVEVVSAAGYPLAGGPDGVVSFHPGALFAGQERRVWVTLRVPTGGAAADARRHALGALALGYVQAGEPRRLELAALPDVEVVAEEAEFGAGLDTDTGGASVAEDALGALKQQVSTALQRGDTASALAEVRTFRQEQERLNARVASPAVTRVLEDVTEMEARVGAAAGPGAAPARNRLSKKYSAEGYDVRRPGAKYDAR